MTKFCQESNNAADQKQPINLENSKPCGSNRNTDSLIVEWTQEGVKLLREEKVIVSKKWSSTDGRCLKKAKFWRIQNYGTTVISGESIQGTNFLEKFFPRVLFSFRFYMTTAHC